jgi:hypothetical protein
MARRPTPNIQSLTNEDALELTHTASLIPNLSDSESVDEALSDEQSFSAILSELGTSGSRLKIYAYRRREGKKDEYCTSFEPSDFSLDELGRLYGGGEYRIRVYAGGQGGARLNRLVTIAAPAVDPADIPFNRDRAATLALAQIQVRGPVPPDPNFNPGTNAGNSIAELVGAMNLGLARLGELIVQSAQAAKPDRAAWLQEMMMMKQIFGDNSPKGDPMEIFMRAVEFAKGLQPRDGEVGSGEILLETLKQFGGPLLEGMKGMKRMDGPSAMPSPAFTGSPAAPETSNFSAMPALENAPMQDRIQEGSNMDMKTSMLRQGLHFLAQQAQAGSDPGLYAELVLDQAGDEEASGLLGNAQWFEILAGIEPSISPHRPWFEELKTAALELLTEPEKTSTSGEHAPIEPSATGE